MDALEQRRVVFVTGASRGIGRGIASAFLAAGHKVAFGYHNNREMAEEAAGSNAGSSERALAVQVDIAERASIQAALEATNSHFGGTIEVLVNNAAMAQEKPFLTITDDDWDNMLGVNLRSNFAFAQEVIPAMIEKSWGRIINISSIGGQWGGFNQVHYAAAKAAQLNLTKSLAKLFSGDGIMTNSIAIGLCDTDMSAPELKSDAGREKVAGIPVGRLATVDEIAAAAVFLASDAAGYITGQTINMNGGMYMG